MPKRAQWRDGVIRTGVNWPDGKAVFIRPAADNSRRDKELRAIAQKPKTKNGTQSTLIVVQAPVDWKAFMYNARKDERGQLLITRRERGGKRVSRKQREAAKKTAVQKAREEFPAGPITKEERRRRRQVLRETRAETDRLLGVNPKKRREPRDKQLGLFSLWGFKK